jgi:hypothetical protein
MVYALLCLLHPNTTRYGKRLLLAAAALLANYLLSRTAEASAQLVISLEQLLNYSLKGAKQTRSSYAEL